MKTKMKKNNKNNKKEILTTDLFPEYTIEYLHNSLEESRLKDNEAIIDEKLGELSEMLGRKLREDEVEEILEIVDKYTPVKEDGTYLTELLPFDYAWKVYKARRLTMFD